MIIRDLSHLEVATEEVTGGYIFENGSSTINFTLNVSGTSSVKGNLAGAQAGADAYGTNTQAQAVTATLTAPGRSSAGSTSVSSSNNNPAICFPWFCF